MGERQLSTAWLLAGEFGVTMTEDQFRERFAPKDADRTFRHKVAVGTYPAPVGQVFDTQEVGAWWDEMLCRRR